jgi:multidrug efflux pump subunit AcrA (membrane-fusion protein)
MTTQSTEQSAQLDLPAADDPPEPAPGPSAAEIDRCLHALSQLAQSELSELQFYESLLDHLVATLSAPGGAVWQLHPRAPTKAICHLDFPQPLLSSHRHLPEKTLENPSVELVGAVALRQMISPAAIVALDIGPVVQAWIPAESQRVSLVEIALPQDAGRDAERGAEQLLEVVAEIAADYHRRRELRLLRTHQAQSAKLADCVARLHRSLDPTATAYTLAHEGQQWIGCDRVSVLQVCRGKALTIAISGAPHIDRRSGQIAALERVATAVAVGGEPLAWQEGQTDDMAPEVSARLQAYLDRAHARQWVAVPLAHPPHVLEETDVARDSNEPAFGLLVAESFIVQEPLQRLVDRTREFACWSESAFGNALQHHAIPFLSLQTQLGNAKRAITRRPIAALVGLLGLAGVMLALVFVPADFDVQVEGTLQPQIRRNLFAPSDGVVEGLRVDHGDRIAAGESLLRIRNSALDLERARLRGDLQSAQSKLEAVQASRSRPTDAGDASMQDRLASEQQQLQLQIQGLERQQAVAEQLWRELELASPLEGIVLTWNTHQLLDDRPVKQGQLLLTIADPAGPWGLELRIPDRQAGHILASTPGGQPNLPVSYLLASDPTVTHRGQLSRLALASDTVEGRSAAAAVATLEGPLPSQARAGTHVTARVHCGQRSLGYVWFHDLIDFVRTSLPF